MGIFDFLANSDNLTLLAWSALGLAVPAWFLYRSFRISSRISENVVVTDIFIYPIKSCKGIRLNNTEFCRTGFKNDRIWMVATPKGEFVSQRTIPKMALIETRFDDDGTLVVSAPGMPELSVGKVGDISKRRLTVKIWDSDPFTSAIVSGECDAWFSEFIGKPVHLVHVLPESNHFRPLPEDYNPLDSTSEINVGFADGFPFLICSISSLADLNDRISEPVSIMSFRPNIVVSGCLAFEEDLWTKIRIADQVFHVVKPCSRCSMPNVDPELGSRRKSKQPGTILSQYRRIGKSTYFGQNAIHCSEEGMISVGDQVQVEAYSSSSVSWLSV